MPSQIQDIPKIKPMSFPDLKLIETDSVPAKSQSLKEWAMAGGGVPASHKGREHVWHKNVQKYAAGGEVYNTVPDMKDGGDIIPGPAYAKGGEVRMADGGAAFGKFPQMKGKRSKQDREASKNVPIDLARGAVAGALGAPGDIESLVRMLPGFDERTFLPTSEEIEKRLPFRSESPVNKVASNLGTLAGGFYTGPGSPFRAAAALPSAAKRAAKELAPTAGSMVMRAAETGGMPAQGLGIVKPMGGNWLPSFDSASPYQRELDIQLNRLKKGQHDTKAEHIKQVMDDDAARGDTGRKALMERSYQEALKKEAGNKWVDSNLRNYITKQMATEADPVRKLAEEGITAFPKMQDEYGDDILRNYGSFTAKRRREETGFPKEGVAQSKLAKHYETLSDEAVDPIKAERLQRTQALPPMQRPRGAMEMPWVNKLDPESHVYRMGEEANFEGLGFNHIMDVLREDVAAGRIRPEQLNKISMEDAVRRSHQYDEELKAKMLNARVAEQASANVFKEYPEGYKWVQLDKPGQFSLESDIMGHSVRGYEPPKGHPDYIDISGDSGYDSYGHGGYEAIKSGDAKIYSLRDPKGMSHATVEVGKPALRTWDDVTKAVGKEKAAALHKEFYDIGADRTDNTEAAMAMFLKNKGVEPREYISQVKGKQNAAPNEEYLPYIQDFVRGGDWADVKDIQNTGLVKHPETGEFVTREKRRAEVLAEPDFPAAEGPRMAGGGAAIKAALAKLGKFASESDLAAVKEAGRVAHEQEAIIRAAKNADIEKRLQAMPARSKAANIEMGLYHPVGGGAKLAKPFEAMHSTRVPNPKVKTPDVKILTPEDLYKERAAFYPLVGDKADTGTFLTHIGEKELEVPVGLGGGPRYMDVNYDPKDPARSAAWESGTSRVTSLGNQAQRAGDGGNPVYGVYTAGSGTNTDFNVMGTNAVLQQLPQSKFTKKTEKAFDSEMRSIYPEWPGVRNEEAADLLMDKSQGELRKSFLTLMGSEPYQKAGLPDVPATRKAIMDPQLYDVPTNESGFRIARMDPTGRIIEDPLHPSDYPTAMAGEVAGQLNQGADYKDMFSTHFANRRLLSQPESGDYYSFSRAHPIQYADQEWLDKIMKAQEAKDKLIKTGKYAKGGLAAVNRKATTE